VVQASRSSQGCPFITACATHIPFVVSHTPRLQPWVSAEQSYGEPPRQVPALQVLPTEHRSV
jgi:hypothetical protein